MSNMQNTIWTFKTARFRVVVGWDWEDDPDLSWDETGEVTAKLNSGAYGNYCFAAKVYCDGREISASYLGNSIHADPQDFRDHRCGSYFSDMVREVCREARKALCDVPPMRCIPEILK